MKKTTGLLSVITAINVLVATGYSITGIINPAAMLPPGTETGQGAFIFALYAAARTLPLAALALFAAFGRKPHYLVILAILAGTVQFLDGFIGIYQQDILKSAGPFFLAIIQFVAVGLYLSKTGKERI